MDIMDQLDNTGMEMKNLNESIFLMEEENLEKDSEIMKEIVGIIKNQQDFINRLSEENQKTNQVLESLLKENVELKNSILNIYNNGAAQKEQTSFISKLNNSISSFVSSADEKAKELNEKVKEYKKEGKRFLARINLHKFAGNLATEAKGFFANLQQQYSERLDVFKNELAKAKNIKNEERLEEKVKNANGRIRIAESIKNFINNVQRRGDLLRATTTKDVNEVESKVSEALNKNRTVDFIDKYIENQEKNIKGFVNQIDELQKANLSIDQYLKDRERVNDLDISIDVKSGIKELTDIELFDKGFNEEQIGVILNAKENGYNIQPFVNTLTDTAEMQVVSYLMMRGQSPDIIPEYVMKNMVEERNTINFFEQNTRITGQDNSEKINQAWNKIDKMADEFVKNSNNDVKTKDGLDK